MNDGLKEKHRRAVIEILAAHSGVERAVLFGSRAMGAHTITSDVDIVIFGDRLTLTDQARLAREIDHLPMPQRVDLLRCEAIKDKKLLMHIRKHGVEWFSRTRTQKTLSGETRRCGGRGGEWPETNFAEVLVDGTRNGIYKKREFHGSGVKIVNMGELFAHPRLFSMPMKRVQLTDKEITRTSLQPGDLLFARRSLVAEGAGKCSIVMEVDEPTTFESSIIRGRPDPKKADSLFLYYYFNSPQGVFLLGTIRRQVAVAGITGTDLVQLRIPLPPLQEQCTIAHLLGTLDDKIELNRRMNRTLEKIATAIFKSWFIDFDPVRAKAEGQDPGLPKDIADLFPDGFEDSELGEIPKEWEVGVLSDVLVELETGGRPKGGVSKYKRGIPSIGAESIVRLGIFNYAKTKFIPKDFFNNMKKGHLKSRDVLLYKDGGRPGQFEPHVTLFGNGFPFDACAINEHVYRIVARPEYGQNLLFFWLSSDLAMEEMRVKGTGVAIPGLNSTQVKSLTTLIPPVKIAKAFDAIVEPYIRRILMNCNQSRALSRLRDRLLPKLVSGKLKLPGIGDPREEVAV